MRLRAGMGALVALVALAAMPSESRAGRADRIQVEATAPPEMVGQTYTLHAVTMPSYVGLADRLAQAVSAERAILDSAQRVATDSGATSIARSPGDSTATSHAMPFVRSTALAVTERERSGSYRPDSPRHDELTSTLPRRTPNRQSWRGSMDARGTPAVAS